MSDNPKYALVLFDEQNRVVFQAENVVDVELLGGVCGGMPSVTHLKVKLLRDGDTGDLYRMRVYDEVTV